jgi:hypothetical protein
MEMVFDLEEIILYLNANEPTGRFCKNIENLKNKLLKAQEQEKVLEIIKEKNVDVLVIKESKTLEEYNRNAWEVEHYGKFKGYRLQLTQEEYNSIKEMLKDE